MSLPRVHIVLEDAFQSVAIRGTVATVGAPPVGAKVQLDVFSILIKGITYVGSCAGDAEARTVRDENQVVRA